MDVDKAFDHIAVTKSGEYLSLFTAKIGKNGMGWPGPNANFAISVSLA